MATYLEVTQIRSTIGRPEVQRQTIRGLGLGKLNRTVKLKDSPQTRGMIVKVQHLLDVKVREGDIELSGRRHRK
jgi:large subunit ribosomal protein L30